MTINDYTTNLRSRCVRLLTPFVVALSSTVVAALPSQPVTMQLQSSDEILATYQDIVVNVLEKEATGPFYLENPKIVTAIDRCWKLIQSWSIAYLDKRGRASCRTLEVTPDGVVDHGRELRDWVLAPVDDVIGAAFTSGTSNYAAPDLVAELRTHLVFDGDKPCLLFDNWHVEDYGSRAAVVIYDCVTGIVRIWVERGDGKMRVVQIEASEAKYPAGLSDTKRRVRPAAARRFRGRPLGR